MLGVVFLLQLTLWTVTVHAFFPWLHGSAGECTKEQGCTESERRTIRTNSDLQPAWAARGVASLPLVKVRTVASQVEPSDKVARALHRAFRKYGHHNPSRTADEKQDMVKRANTYSIVSAAVPTATGSVGIDQDGTDYSYFVQASFGSAQTPLYLLLDTGAGSTWIPGASCKSAACTMHNTYDTTASKSWKPSTNKFSIGYGSGHVSGIVGADAVTIGSLKTTFSFGVASETSDDFKFFPFDGILGLSMALGNTTDNFVQLAKSGKVLAANVYSFYITRNSDGPDNGEVTFGGTNAAKFTGPITYTTVSKDGGGDWAIPLDGIAYNGKDAGIKGRLAYIDTGTSYCFGPPADITALHKLVPGATLGSDNATWTVPCLNAPAVTVTFSGVTYTVSPKDWVSPPNTAGVCTSNFIGHEVVTGAWLLGDVFLKNVYAVFDADKSQIGFASRASSLSPSTSPLSSSPSATAAISTTGTISVTPVPSASTGTGTTRPGLSGHETSATAIGESAAPTSTGISKSPGEQLESSIVVTISCVVAVVALLA